MMRRLMLAGGGAIWTPASLSTPPSFWVNDDSAVTDAGAGACSQWNDISGNGYHLTQSTAAARPLIVASGLNGRRTIRSDGSDDRMSNVSAGFLDMYRARGVAWIYCVFKKNATGSTGIRTLWNPSTPTAGNVRFALCTSAVGTDTPQVRVRRQDADAAAGLNASGSIGTEWNQWLVIMDWSTGDCFLYKNNSLDASNLSLTTSGNTDNTASNAITLFNSSAASAGSAVELAEFATGFGYYPNSTDRSNFFAYGTNRWAV